MGPGVMPPFLGGNNTLNSEGGPLPQTSMAPTPGTVTIHLNGRVVWWMGAHGGNDQVNTTAAGTYKNNVYQTGGYFRLYPGVDGLAANGLRYGAITEIRMNFAPGTLSSGSESLYVRRAAIYAGTDQFGLIRVGQDDGPFSQMDGGITTFQFTDGAWNGDIPNTFPTNASVVWPFWSGTGNEYTIDKAVYFSPQIAGFDLGVSFAPSDNSFSSTGCSAPGVPTGATCNSISSSPVASDSARFTNMVEVMARYRAKFNDVGVYAIAGYAGSGHVNTTAAVGNQYDGFSVGDFGLTLTYAGVSVGGNVLVGDYNGGVALKPRGGARSISWVAGATYTTGPMLFGVQYFNQQDQGAKSLTALVGKSQETSSGLALSAQYSVAPGFALIADYLYGFKHQGDWDYLNNRIGTANNDMHNQSLFLYGKVSW
jgi:hypothetical protein